MAPAADANVGSILETGSRVRIRVHIEVAANSATPVNSTYYSLLSDIEHTALHPVEQDWTIRFPVTNYSPLEYVSSADEYVYQLQIQGAGKMIADFSATSKERFIVRSVFPSIDALGTITTITLTVMPAS